MRLNEILAKNNISLKSLDFSKELDNYIRSIINAQEQIDILDNMLTNAFECGHLPEALKIIQQTNRLIYEQRYSFRKLLELEDKCKI